MKLSLSKDFAPVSDTPSYMKETRANSVCEGEEETYDNSREVDKETMRRAQLRLTHIIGEAIRARPNPTDGRPACEMFLNISLKKLYETLYELCTEANRPPLTKDYKENYKKIFLYITTTVPNADRMTVRSFLRYIGQHYMAPRNEEKETKEQYRQRILEGNRLAELFFLYTFFPLTRRRGICFESVTYKLSPVYMERTRRKE